MKTNIILYTSALLIGIAGIFILVKNYQTKQDFSCLSYQTLYHDDTVIKGVFNFSFNGDHGTLKVDGHIEQAGENRGYISRTIVFSFKIKENHYILTGKRISKLPLDNAETNGIQLHVPSILMTNDEVLDLFISNDGQRGKIISFGNFPTLYCNNPH